MNKTLVFNDVEMTKKDFYDAKKAIPLSLVDINNIVVSNKVKNNNETSKCFIGYLNDIDDVNPLCIILAQMDGYIKYFENGGKCHLKLKMMKYISNTTKYGAKLKNC